MSEQDKYNKPPSDLKILGINLLIFAVYTIWGFLGKGDNIIFSFIAAVIHFMVCCIEAVIVRRWSWFLAGLIIIVIGLGTCVNTIRL
ncbi:hypothetical protein [Mucilaginibacter jinjuensis]|uniref:Uncharacterized protein n=1 Tax=Mucilaginibacter jinjuensis TaxID=1176721 RepID=A0ABY7TAL8_9SPHI|nr:hypothetical protein [Mucilaginibacter jinjuensis]WCT12996.1 hypothetical protein PQO05_03490 [Mucilaginibacter jinjuensis]